MTGRALRRLGPVKMKRRRGVWATPLMLATMAMTTMMMMMARPPGTAGVASLYSVHVCLFVQFIRLGCLGRSWRGRCEVCASVGLTRRGLGLDPMCALTLSLRSAAPAL